MNTVRLTMAQALVRYLTAQKVEIDGQIKPLFAGVFAIFGHGNVAGLGEALYHQQAALPTYRAHNEQAMAHAAIAYAKANNRQQIMACTTSIGPGATNMVTAAALAHVNRIPVLLLPGDTFAARTPDPVLQQVECASDPTISANDCFRPVSRYFDRISRPEQLITSLPAAISTLVDAELAGPVTLSLPQDVQAEAYDYPESFFAETVHYQRQQAPDTRELAAAIDALKNAKKPLLIAGGGVHYAQAIEPLKALIESYGIPVAETQAGKGALAWDHPNYVGAIGVTGCDAANKLAEEADLVLAVGTRLQDFTTASRTLFRNPDVTLIQLNVARMDAIKHNAKALVCDAKIGLEQLHAGLAGWQVPAEWQAFGEAEITRWNGYYDQVTSIADAPKTETGLPSDAQVLGAVKRTGEASDIIVCAAGGLPGDLHKLWRTEQPNGYHLEYGFSCMGYEIAGGLGVKMAKPDREVIVVVGDGSYLMMNSEIATTVMLNKKVIIVVLDNRGFGCINRLQRGTGGASFNNLLDDGTFTETGAPKIDFAAHAKALGAESESVGSLEALEEALGRARAASQSYVIAIDTDPYLTAEGGSWWEVGVPEVSERETVTQAYREQQIAKQKQPY